MHHICCTLLRKGFCKETSSLNDNIPTSCLLCVSDRLSVPPVYPPGGLSLTCSISWPQNTASLLSTGRMKTMMRKGSSRQQGQLQQALNLILIFLLAKSLCQDDFRETVIIMLLICAAVAGGPPWSYRSLWDSNSSRPHPGKPWESTG